jgi:FkbM family methyltransferase
MPCLRTLFFSRVVEFARRLPAFRGKTRLFLLLYAALGLSKHHVPVRANLLQPTRYTVDLDLHSWLQRIALLTGGYECDTTEFLLRLHSAMDPEGYLLDVGANIGLIAIPYALLLRRTRDVSSLPKPCTVCIEAVATNGEALMRNVSLNSADDLITILNMALGEVQGNGVIQIEGDLANGEGTGTANVLPADSTYECMRVPIQITTLDAVFNDGRLPDGCAVVKIDTDGYDLKILEGGLQFLRSARPVIFGEFSAHCLNWHGQDLDDVRLFAERVNYLVCQRSSPHSWSFTSVLDKVSFTQDLLMIPAEAVSRFSWCLESGSRNPLLKRTRP